MLTVTAEPLDGDDAKRLIGELDEYLNSLYPPEDNFLDLPTADLFLVARDDGVPVGCGAVRLFDDGTAEIKRMYVTTGARGAGVGRRLLVELEVFARDAGAARLVLETGPQQHAAIRLYERFGFHVIPCWGEYASGNNSVCYEKLLT